jgi:hypothetical protein
MNASDRSPNRVGKKRLVVGYVLTGFVALFLTFDTILNVLRLAPAVKERSRSVTRPIACSRSGGLYLRETRLGELLPFRH